MDFHQTLYIKEFPATLKELQEVLSAYKSPVSIVNPDEKPIEEQSGRVSFSYQNAIFNTKNAIVNIEINFKVNNRFKEPIYEKASHYSRFVTFKFDMSDMMALRVVYMLCLPLVRKYDALFRDNYYNIFLSPAELAVISTELNALFQVSILNIIDAISSMTGLAFISYESAALCNSSIPESIKREFKPREVKTLSNVPKLEKYFECQWYQWKFPTPRPNPFCNECKARCPFCGSLDSSCKDPGEMQFMYWKEYWYWVALKHEKAGHKLSWTNSFDYRLGKLLFK